MNRKGMGAFHFGNAFEIDCDGITWIVWDQCVNFDSKGSTHLFNIDNLRSTPEYIREAVIIFDLDFDLDLEFSSKKLERMKQSDMYFRFQK